MKNFLVFAIFVLSAIGCKKTEVTLPKIPDNISFGTMTDNRDDNTYNTIRIGNQEWMVEDLRFRLSGGSLDGCYTYGENAINLTQLEIDNSAFIDSVRASIARGEIENPDDVPVMQQPTTIISLYINLLTPRQLMDYLTPYPDAVAILERIYKHLLDPAAIIQAELNFEKAEKENGYYSHEYGFLYTFEAAKEAIPEGWRMPTDEDWKELEKQLGVSDVDALEEWRGNVAGRFLLYDDSGIGFGVRLGGGRLYGTFMYGTPFLNKEVNGYYWTSTEYVTKDSTELAIHRIFMKYRDGVWRGTAKKDAAYHVKCIKN